MYAWLSLQLAAINVPVRGCLNKDCLINRSSMGGCVLNHTVIFHVSGCLDEDLQ